VKLAITTCYKPTPAHLARASSLSARFSAPLLERRAYEHMFDGIDLFYVVARAHDEVRERDGAACFVQPGLLSSKLTQKREHPFIRALGDASSLFDCTLGLGSDTLHAQTVLKCSVVGTEASPILFALLEEGLPRLGVTAEIHNVHALERLREMESKSVDVVMMDPMMSRAKKSAPSFELLRKLALHDKATPELVDEAKRVGRRVVMKLGKGQPMLFGFTRYELGAHVTYWVHE
jgi:hypothetical protein